MWQLYTFIMEVMGAPKGMRPTLSVTLQGGDDGAKAFALQLVEDNGAMQATIVHVTYDSARFVAVVTNPKLS
jgi:hypothetical protein